MKVEIDVTCMDTNFRGHGFSSFGDKNGLKSMVVENLVNHNQLKKFMQVGIDVTCMYTNFGGCGVSGFGNKITFQKRQNFLFRAWTIVRGHQKI